MIMNEHHPFTGKTVAGELAIYYALALDLQVYYTTPLKALSNQKYVDFCRQFGTDRVGLLTGDTNINRGAQVREGGREGEREGFLRSLGPHYLLPEQSVKHEGTFSLPPSLPPLAG